MSYSITDLTPIKAIDPRVNIQESVSYLFKQSANVVTFKSWTANSSSASSVTFQANPPNPGIVCSRLAYLTIRPTFVFKASVYGINQAGGGQPNSRLPVDISDLFSGAGDNGNNYICPRQFPLASAMRNLRMVLNTVAFNSSPDRYIHALSRFNLNDWQRAYPYSASPAQPDQFQDYNDESARTLYTQTDNGAANAAVAGSAGRNLGNARNVFGSYGSNSTEMSRGAYTPISIVYDNNPASDTFGDTTVVYEFTEPIFLSPLSNGEDNTMGFAQVSTMEFEVNWSTKLTRMLSIDLSGIQNNAQANGIAFGGANYNSKANSRRIDSITVSIDSVSNNKLTMLYLTPQIDKIIPRSLVYDLHEIEPITRNITGLGLNGALDPGVEGTFYSGNISLTSIPSKIYVFARERESVIDHYSSDCFARITNINVTFNGISGILNNAEEWDLWRMACSNGLNISFAQWKYYTGSVFCIDFGKDIGLMANQCVGLLGRFDFEYNIRLANIGKYSKFYDLMTVIVKAGTVTITDGMVTTMTGIISNADVVKAQEAGEADLHHVEKMYGGSFMSGLRNVYSKAQRLKPYAKSALSVAKTLAPVLETIAPRTRPLLDKSLELAEHLLGQGYTKAEVKRMLKGGNVGGSVNVGGNMVLTNAAAKAVARTKMQQRLGH